VPNTGLDAVKLHDGKLLMVHNQLPKPGMAQSVRGVLVLSVSMDDGKTWRKSLTLEVTHPFPVPVHMSVLIEQGLGAKVG
jgi:hypothetical protein